MVGTTRDAPTRKEAPKSLTLTLLKGQRAGFEESTEIATKQGGRLLQTVDLALLPKGQLEELVHTLRNEEWLWLGDKKGLEKTEVREVQERLWKALGGSVDVVQGSGQLALSFGARRFVMDAYHRGGLNAPLVAVVSEKSAP